MGDILRRFFRSGAAPGGKMNITVRAETDTGRVCDHNEDCFAALGGEESPSGVDALLVVADGMGGHAAGEVASKMTVDRILGLLATSSEESSSIEGNDFGVFLAN